jgi:hypothetical protein
VVAVSPVTAVTGDKIVSPTSPRAEAPKSLKLFYPITTYPVVYTKFIEPAKIGPNIGTLFFNPLVNFSQPLLISPTLGYDRVDNL